MYVKCKPCRIAFHTVDDYGSGTRRPTIDQCPNCDGPVAETKTIYYGHPEIEASADQRAKLSHRLNMAKALYSSLYEGLDLTQQTAKVQDRAYQLYLQLVLGGEESTPDGTAEADTIGTGKHTDVT